MQAFQRQISNNSSITSKNMCYSLARTSLAFSEIGDMQEYELLFFCAQNFV
jgi:hypothetical protein